MNNYSGISFWRAGMNIAFAYIVSVAALMMAVGVAKAQDSITITRQTVEPITEDSPTSDYFYGDFRPSSGTNWFRVVDKYEMNGTSIARNDFKIRVPDDYASSFNPKGIVSGLLIRRFSDEGEITGFWNKSGSADTDLAGLFTELFRVYDGFSSASRLSSSNPFTIEYLVRQTNNLVVVTNGFQVAPGTLGAELGGEWDSYLIHSIATPTPYVPIQQPPSQSAFSVSNHVVSITITNLTIGASNTVQRTHDLLTGTWTNVDTFISTDVQKQWQETVEPEWQKAFYRIKSEK